MGFVVFELLALAKERRWQPVLCPNDLPANSKKLVGEAAWFREKQPAQETREPAESSS